jgi:dimethylamine/trimethylamine dehydrogenase
MQVLTPDDLMDGVAPRGARVVLFDDDHYSMGGALAEQLQKAGSQVTHVTSAAAVSQWTQHTMEQARIQRRLLELGVTIRTSHALISAATGGVTLACAYTDRESEIECDALVLVTARTASDSIAADLAGRDGGVSVRAVGDAWSPGTIAAAVWDGRRYAEELDEPEQSGDDALFRREVVALAPR